MGAAALALAGVSTLATASQADPWQSVCTGGDIATGTYQNLWVTGAPPACKYSTVGGRVVGQCGFVLNPDTSDS